MHFTITFVALFASLTSLSLASPLPQTDGTPLILWNGVSDITVYQDSSTANSVKASINGTSPDSDIARRIDQGDVTDCSGSVSCGNLGGPLGQCAAASRLIYSGNIYSTTGNAGRTGVCSGHCGIFVSGTNCQVTGAQLLDAYTAIHMFGCSDCGKVTLASNGCTLKMDFVLKC